MGPGVGRCATRAGFQAEPGRPVGFDGIGAAAAGGRVDFHAVGIEQGDVAPDLPCALVFRAVGEGAGIGAFGDGGRHVEVGPAGGAPGVLQQVAVGVVAEGAVVAAGDAADRCDGVRAGGGRAGDAGAGRLAVGVAVLARTGCAAAYAAFVGDVAEVVEVVELRVGLDTTPQ